MNMWMAWFSMHGYASYVWSAYGLVFGVLSVHIFCAIRFGRSVRQRLLREFSHASSTTT